jgi:hypothetical protein
MHIDYKNFSSEYELKHIIWVGIEYDREKLINFFDRYQQLKFIPKTNDSQEELRVMEEILKTHNFENLQKLLQNDADYCRWATIEKLSRKGALEILLDGKYSKETFNIISNLPTFDFKLIMKRAKELITTINEMVNDSDIDMSKTPGVR